MQIVLPLPVGSKVGAARLALDHPDLALGAERHHINAQPRRGHQFLDRRKAMAQKMAAHPAGKALTGGKKDGFGYLRHICGHKAKLNEMGTSVKPLPAD
ncbi:hypothetical protein GCM10010991_09700 [Gemmobacter aquaticus]|uniref:Uncharacterized protein n=1 Tax=Gemmobacter aquaticus TaxID=490185 RepID=A0A917YIY6_9RHOB|nr:hypothetical protein GCM10010991_09700 [Gemmobacter aquaticus]